MTQLKPMPGTLECIRCGYTWQPRTDRIPKQCPSCKSKVWNRERRRLRAAERLAVPYEERDLATTRAERAARASGRKGRKQDDHGGRQQAGSGAVRKDPPRRAQRTRKTGGSR